MASYAAVRSVSGFLQFAAWGTVLLGGGASIVLMITRSPMIAAGVFGVATVSFVLTLAMGQLLEIAADVGEATAKTAVEAAKTAASVKILADIAAANVDPTAKTG
ncbi:MAG: hypothetical protein ACHREM_06440 [Polyangiales bacterium]